MWRAFDSDKRLWVLLFSRHVQARSLRFPRNLQDIEVVDARDIESWVKHSVLLDRRLKTQDIPLSVRKVDIRDGLRVTWLKIILSRWCLVAAANDDLSELSLWDMLSTAEIRCAAKVFLDAPVMDGQIDCSTEARCAITVGTTRPYILVFGLYQSQHNASLQELARLPGASHVQYFRGDLVAFAVRNGDDTYPYIWNWKTRDVSCLRVPHDPSSNNYPLPVEACKAITMKDGYIVTLHYSVVHVFSTYSANPRHIRALHFAGPVIAGAVTDGWFLDGVSSGSHTKPELTVIRFLYQTVDSDLLQATIKLGEGEGERGEEACTMEESSIKQPPNMPTYRCLSLLRTGILEKTIFCVTSSQQCAWWNPYLLCASLRIRNDSGSAGPLEVDGDYITISRDGLPLLQMLSVVDFDDGAGILIVGTFHGDVRVGCVLPEPVLTPQSIHTQLSDDAFLSTGLKSRWSLPIPLVLPPFYDIRKQRKSFRPADDTVIRTISKWLEPNLEILSLYGWSNDWLNHESVWNWLTPLSRWGPLDADFMEVTAESSVRNRLHALGDIIPVVFLSQNHNEVVFRIGQRMFYCRTQHPDESDEDDFVMHEFLLGVLPFTFKQFLHSPIELPNSLSDRLAITESLDLQFSALSLSRRMDTANIVYKILADMERTHHKQYDIALMNNWSDDEWDDHALSALGMTLSKFKEPDWRVVEGNPHA